MCTNTLPRSGGLLVATHPDVAPVTAGMISNFAKKIVQIEIITYGYFFEAITFLSNPKLELFQIICSLGKKKSILEFVTLFYRGFLKLLLLTGRGTYS